MTFLGSALALERMPVIVPASQLQGGQEVTSLVANLTQIPKMEVSALSANLTQSLYYLSRNNWSRCVDLSHGVVGPRCQVGLYPLFDRS